MTRPTCGAARLTALLCGLLLIAGRAAADAAAPTAPAAAACGNGLLDADETCDTCAADCAVHACTPSAARRAVTVALRPPLGEEPTAATLRIGYRGTALRLPGGGGEAAVRARLRPLVPDTTLTPNDLGYALRVVALGSRAFVGGPLFAVEFDRCSAADGGAVDLSCVVEGCAASGAPIAGCTCAVTEP